MWRFLMIRINNSTNENIQIRFSKAPIKLDVLVTSIPTIGRNRNVEIMYGALQAMQKYVSNFVEGVDAIESDSLGQLCVSITDAAST